MLQPVRTETFDQRIYKFAIPINESTHRKWICELELSLFDGSKTVATGFLLNVPEYDGSVLVTCAELLFSRAKTSPRSIRVSVPGEGVFETSLRDWHMPDKWKNDFKDEFNFAVCFVPRMPRRGFGWSYIREVVGADLERVNIGPMAHDSDMRSAIITSEEGSYRLDSRGVSQLAGSPIWSLQKGGFVVAGLFSPLSAASGYIVRIGSRVLGYVRSLFAGTPTYTIQLKSNTDVHLVMSHNGETEDGWVQCKSKPPYDFGLFNIIPVAAPSDDTPLDEGMVPYQIQSAANAGWHLSMDADELGKGQIGGHLKCEIEPPTKYELFCILKETDAKGDELPYGPWYIQSYLQILEDHDVFLRMEPNPSGIGLVTCRSTDYGTQEQLLIAPDPLRK